MYFLVSSAGVVHESALARTAAFQGFRAFRGERLREGKSRQVYREKKKGRERERTGKVLSPLCLTLSVSFLLFISLFISPCRSFFPPFIYPPFQVGTQFPSLLSFRSLRSFSLARRKPVAIFHAVGTRSRSLL